MRNAILTLLLLLSLTRAAVSQGASQGAMQSTSPGPDLAASRGPELPTERHLERAQGSGEAIVLSGKAKLEELVAVFGAYSTAKPGDGGKTSCTWKAGASGSVSAYLEEGRLSILILRTEAFAYKGVVAGASLAQAVKAFGEPEPKTEAVQEGRFKDLYFKAENLRLDVDRTTDKVHAVFLYF